MEVIVRLLHIYSFVVLCILILFLFLIARFYEKKARERTRYWLFLIPLLFYLISGIRYFLSSWDITGDQIGDISMTIGGALLLYLGHSLLTLMMGRRR